MSRHFLIFAAVAAACACSCSPKGSYILTGTVDTLLNGKTAYLYDYHNNTVVDSVIVADGQVRFTGRIIGDSIRRIDVGREYANLILEPGDIVVDFTTNNASGTPKNEALNAIDEKKRVFWQESRAGREAIKRDSTLDARQRDEQLQTLKTAMLSRFAELVRPVVEANDDAVGAMVFWDWINELGSPADFDTAYASAGEYIRGYGPIIRISLGFESIKKTSAGMMFTDFTIPTGSADSTAVSLSDYVGKGKYILVDFWASWCGPCMKEMPLVREVWEKHHGPRFEVLGIATWDERAHTQEAIRELKLSWPQIFYDGEIPTDLYGIQSIPHLILFAPDGRIVARDLRGGGIEQAVAEALAE